MKWLPYFFIFSCISVLYSCDEIQKENSDEKGVNETALRATSILDIPLDDLSNEETQKLITQSDSYPFQTEVSRLLDIIINSLYTHKSVFIRELISNAADALEKARILSVSDPTYLDDFNDLEIRIQVDEDKKIIIIRDTGIGMTRQDMIDNLGTVARSGTSNFLEALAESGDINLIGQFGVGFYSAFLVADRVTVSSKHHDDPDQHIWESNIGGSFSIGKDPRGNTLIRGTQVILHLKNDSSEFLDRSDLRLKIENYNQFINYPIKLLYKSANGTATVASDWQLVNSQKPIWLRPKEELNETDYLQFYDRMYFDMPIAYTHFSGEGEVEFKALVFIPSRPPNDRYASYMKEEQDSIKLYSHRILVSESTKDILPKWLGFVQGIVDTEDLPLKVDRESFSKSKAISIIRKKLVSKFFELIHKLSKKDREEWTEYRKKIESESTKIGYPKTEFLKFWLAFGKHLKLGCMEDPDNQEKIAKVLRYSSSKRDKLDRRTLDEYVEDMEESQKDIYYITAESYEQAMESPHIKYFLSKNYEIIILTETLDQNCFDRLHSYKDKNLVSIEKISTSKAVDDSDKERQKLIRKNFKPLTTLYREILQKKVSNVDLSFTLLDEPVVMSISENTASALNDRLARSQLFYNPGQSDNLWKHRTLSLNPNHPIVQKMLYSLLENKDEALVNSTAITLYDLALLNGGYILQDPSRLAKQYLNYFVDSLNLTKTTITEFIPEIAPENEEVSMDDSDDEDGSGKNDKYNDYFVDPKFLALPIDDKLDTLVEVLPDEIRNYYKDKIAYLNETEKASLLEQFRSVSKNPSQALGLNIKPGMPNYNVTPGDSTDKKVADEPINPMNDEL